MWNAAFWSQALTRALRTFAQTALSAFGGNGLNIWTASWHQVIGLSAGAALLSLAMSVDRGTITPDPTPAVTPASTPAALTDVAAKPAPLGGCDTNLR